MENPTDPIKLEICLIVFKWFCAVLIFCILFEKVHAHIWYTSWRDAGVLRWQRKEAVWAIIPSYDLKILNFLCLELDERERERENAAAAAME